ncbi:hypothetical protein BC833DRAFT_640223 [Globomyces pollinis-pini]|nr:hypothetical protein BC833DRAFT_640223 [Globomyces pollinis-pini]
MYPQLIVLLYLVPFSFAADNFNFFTLTGTFTAQATVRDDECIKDASKCKITQGGKVDPGAIGGKTQCGDNALRSDLIGLDNAHFGSQENGKITPVCGLKVKLFNPATGKTVFGFASDRIFQNRGPGNGGTSQVNLTSTLNSQLGGTGKDNIENIQVEILPKGQTGNNQAAPPNNKQQSKSQKAETFNFKTLTGNFFAFGQVRPPTNNPATQCNTDGNANDVVSLDSAHFGTQQNGQKTSLCGRAVRITNMKNGQIAFGRALDRDAANAGPGHRNGFNGIVLSDSLNRKLGGNGQNIFSVFVEVL